MNPNKDDFSIRPDWMKPRIPKGDYTVAFKSYQTARFYRGGAPKLVINFHVIDRGKYFETPLQRYYQVSEIGKTPKKKGFFKAKGQSSHFIMEYVNCFGILPRRLDRVPMDVWKKHAFKARVKDVAWTANQDNLHQMLRYSVIEKILGITEL